MNKKAVFAGVGIGAVVLVFGFILYKRKQAASAPAIGTGYGSAPAGLGIGFSGGGGGGFTDWLPAGNPLGDWNPTPINLDLTSPDYGLVSGGNDYSHLPTTVTPTPTPVYTQPPPAPVAPASTGAPVEFERSAYAFTNTWQKNYDYRPIGS